MRKIFAIISLIVALAVCAVSCSESGPKEVKTSDLAKMFDTPPIQYGPYVWWHWMGPNFSKEGIRKDLEAMKESGIAGATIFNLTSAVQESEAPIGNNPWPDQTYRSEKYWEAIEYAAEVAAELGLKIGLHNSPGYSTTGGPWIDEDKGMRTVVYSKTALTSLGGEVQKVELPLPELPSFSFYSDFVAKATKFEDIAVIALPAMPGASRDDVVDLTGKMSGGVLEWDAPAGKWTVYRIGHACTMAFPHPVPEELIGKVFEADKMNAGISAFHWDNVLGPLKEHVGKYFGKSFTHILIDSYEAGDQNWTEGFREEFVKDHDYDPVPMFALKDAFPEDEAVKAFDEDMKATVSRMFIDNGFKVAADKVHAEGLQLFWEPYSGPFDTAESVAIPDLPMGEFWTHSDGRISATIVDKAKECGKNLVGAEAFTGWPDNSRFTEDPEYLKRSADGTFVSGANLLFLHHWVHQPFDDRYQPGMGMGWWGTHFGRNQTWFKPGKAFFEYLTRCQMMLQQGVLEDRTADWIHRKTTEADIYFVVNQGETSRKITICPWDDDVCPELWNPYSGAISFAPEIWKADSVNVTLDPGASIFVVLNHMVGKAKARDKYGKSPQYIGTTKVVKPIRDEWDVDLVPKVDEPFSLKSFSLRDFSQCPDDRLKYFAGTATYTTKVVLDEDDLAESKRVVINLGEVDDIGELEINGQNVGVFWYPPHTADVTRFLKTGENVITVAVTNNWANRLIGDERLEADFEWGTDRGEMRGRAMKAFPDWFLKGEPRPSGRKAFVIWSYYRGDFELQPAGLVGPVYLVIHNLYNP